jgi:mannose/fructose/N-acetylgalactosamine-specific phosphotransferase system component IID
MTTTDRSTTSEVAAAPRDLPRREFRSIFWRSFTLLGSFNFNRFEGLGFLFSILPALRRIYRDDDEGLRQAMRRHVETFNMTVAPAPLVMGAVIAMEERAKAEPFFDRTAISAFKVSLMGPLSGIGDTFFWGIFRILACSLAIGFAQNGSWLAPIVLLVVFNIPNFATRYYGLKHGYRQGQGIMRSMTAAGKMQLFTYCAGIVGAMAMGSMIALWVPITSPVEFTISGSEFVIQDYLDQIFPALLPITFTVLILWIVRKRIRPMVVIGLVMALGFVLGMLGLIA